MGKDTAPIDICHQNNRAINRLGKTHIGNIAIAQVYFGRRTGTFNQHGFITLNQPLPGIQHGTHRPRLIRVVILSIQIRSHLALDDDLGLTVGGWF